jgi:hypothetical protein
MCTSSILEFPQIDIKYRIKPWCPRVFQRHDKLKYRFFEDTNTASQPMYVALNTPNFCNSIKKAHWQQSLARQEAEDREDAA